VSTALFGFGLALLVLYLLVFAVDLHKENDFYREAWPSYRLLLHGRFLAFLRDGPAYVGSSILRAPFALLAGVFGAGRRAVFIATAVPCLLAPGLLAAYLAATGTGTGATGPAAARRGIRPADLVILAPSVSIAISGGHPEDILGGVLCIFAVLFAQRGWGRAAGLALGVALINKSWALVAVPLVFAVMPADRRLSSFLTMALAAGAVLIPVTVIRASSAESAATSLGGGAVGGSLVPSLVWWFGSKSWIVREGHIVLVAVDWLVTGVWWWLRGRVRRPGVDDALLMLALLLFLRAALDPWDNLYYFAPFMLAVAAYEDRRGFPRLTWLFAIALVVIVPPAGLLNGLGDNGHAAVFAAFALVTVAGLGRRALFPDRPLGGYGYRTAIPSRT